ncbi:methyltransferase domain-containing protein [Candidatus Margulisiibacteriota bacterium]
MGIKLPATSQSYFPGQQKQELLDIALRKFVLAWSREPRLALQATPQALEALQKDPRPLMQLSLEGELLRQELTKVQTPDDSDLPNLVFQLTRAGESVQIIKFYLGDEVAASQCVSQVSLPKYAPSLFEFLEAVQWFERVQPELYRAASAADLDVGLSHDEEGLNRVIFSPSVPGYVTDYRPSNFRMTYTTYYRLFWGNHLHNRTRFKDLGCGPGALAAALSGFFESVTGNDLSELLIRFGGRLLSERGPHLSQRNMAFTCQDFLARDFDPSNTDVFHLFLNFTRSMTAFRNLMQKLVADAEPGSLVVFTDPAGIEPCPGLSLFLNWGEAQVYIIDT